MSDINQHKRMAMGDVDVPSIQNPFIQVNTDKVDGKQKAMKDSQRQNASQEGAPPRGPQKYLNDW